MVLRTSVEHQELLNYTVLRYGPVWEEQLKGLCKQGLSPEAVARYMKTSDLVVRRVATELGVLPPTWEPYCRKPGGWKYAKLCRTDWAKRDEEFCQLAKATVAALRQSSARPVRITTHRIIRRAGIEAIYELHHALLPKTKAYIQSVVESPRDYARRRLEWVKSYFIRRGEVPTTSRLIEKASLQNYRYKLTNEIKAAHQEIIEAVASRCAKTEAFVVP